MDKKINSAENSAELCREFCRHPDNTDKKTEEI